MARIVFDLDGTLIDSVPDIHALANAVTARHRLPPIDLDTARSFVGHGVKRFVERLCALHGLPTEAEPDLLNAFMEGYPKAVGQTVVFDEVAPALAALQAGGHQLGICTNKPTAPTRAVLEHLGLSHWFEVVVAGDTLDVRKPDPAPVWLAFDALGQDGAAIYVGDSPVDAAAAEAAGVDFMLYTEGYRTQAVEDLPHKVAFSDWAAMPDLVAQITSGDA